MTAWQSFFFTNYQGLSLSALFHTATSSPCLTLVVCHGFSGSKEGDHKAIQMAEYFGQFQINTLLFDFTGNGQSEGQFAEITLTRQIRDLECAINWCIHNGLDKIVTLGRSFGGTTAICHASQDDRVLGTCSWAAPFSVFDIFNTKAKPVSGDDQAILLSGDKGSVSLNRKFIDDLKQYNLAHLAPKISPKPVFIVHGSEDETVPPKEAKALFEAAMEPKRLQYIDKGDHTFSERYQEVWQLTLSWLNEYFVDK